MLYHKDHESFYKGKVVLVTGGAGAIGGNLSRVLSELEVKRVIILDDLSSAELWNVPNEKNVMFVEGSVTDERELKRAYAEKPDVVFHLAALFANQKSIDYPETDLMVNGMGLLRTLQYAAMHKVSRFVYASSGCSIYGANAKLPFTEDQHSLYHTSPYQITKMLGELYCNFFWHHDGLPVVKPRFFNSYGPGEIPGQYRNVIPNFIYWALQGKPLVITGDGSATRDFTWVFDLVDALLKCGYMDTVVGEEFNLSSGLEITIKELAELVIKHTGSKAGIVYGETRKWDTKMRLLASTEKAKRLMGYEPSMNFEEGLYITVNWFKEHWPDIEKSAKFGPGVSSAVKEVVR